jgi:hypothetical protein
MKDVDEVASSEAPKVETTQTTSTEEPKTTTQA